MVNGAGPLSSLRRRRDVLGAREMVKAQAGILETDDSQTAATKLARRSRDWLRPHEAAWVESHLRPLLALRASRRVADATSVRRVAPVFRGARRIGSSLLAFEDLHWADDGLLDFIDYVADWSTHRADRPSVHRPPGTPRTRSRGGLARMRRPSCFRRSARRRQERLVELLLRQTRVPRSFDGGARRGQRETRSMPRSSSGCSWTADCSFATAAAGSCVSGDLPVPDRFRRSSQPASTRSR